MKNEFLWVEKYRPKTIKECILPDSHKRVFQKIVDSGKMHNMLLTGTAGLGKTTVARALCNELNLEYLSSTLPRNLVLMFFVRRFDNSLLRYH